MDPQKTDPQESSRRPFRRLPWSEFEKEFRWPQGEHVTLIGVNGAGKTSLARRLLKRPERKHVLILATKPTTTPDPMVQGFEQDGFEVVRDWPLKRQSERVLLWPWNEQVSDLPKQRRVIARALMDMYQQGGWCVYADEAHYISESLRCGVLLELLWKQGRALGVSLVAGNQRPVGIPLEAYSQATHLFFWTMNDDVDVKRAAGIAGVNRQEVVERSLSLPWHDFLYVETRRGTMMQSRLDDGAGLPEA